MSGGRATDEMDGEALEAGRRLFAQACRFVTGAARAGQVPETHLPEVAFAGRSNVGKSSLVNALTGRKTLARVSRAPGRTQQLNFFDLGGRLMLADLPGYGFARAPKDAVKRWTALVEAYLAGRATLRRVCLLIDARHGIKPADHAAMALMDGAAVSYQAVLTKCDRITQAALADLVERIEDELSARPAAHPRVLATSARDGEGIPALRAALAQLAADVKCDAKGPRGPYSPAP